MTDTDPSQNADPAAGFRIEAGAGEWTATILSAVPEGAGLSVAVRPDGPVSIHLVHADAFQALPETGAALYSARVTGPVRFEVAAAVPGDHALVLDNRGGAERRRAEVEITATAPGGVEPEAYEAAADAMLRAVSEGMAQMLRFDPGFSAGRCGRVAPFGEGGLVCIEFPLTVMARVTPREAASGIIMLTIFCRLAEGMAARLGRRLSSEERDGLAVATMTVLGYGGPARAALAHLATPGAAEVLRAEMEADADILPDTGRAQRLRDEGEAGVARWHDVLLASLSDMVLERIETAPPSWTSAGAVATERAARAG
ncbi:hypothetical protein [Jannaschia seohaensis]|uniref:Uncharacterized protein n=1 Tax=Jannaschia seohaensis TaxID=475081 RepID=A0A2Y9BZF1_9RHOB|nr:hypothetical protein [Jannaschia seohaensis]PWJ20239.1 hypothetical protein BCF38_10354 [Jannaschia seohaensis]SSA44242.1 hypothetical protein SAMN05421539_10354 [Jannaschia seohaensis]